MVCFSEKVISQGHQKFTQFMNVIVCLLGGWCFVLLGDSIAVHKQQCVAGVRNMTLEKNNPGSSWGAIKPKTFN